MTVQELTTMLRLELNPTIFVLNNKGYTIERYIHGEFRKYNDVVNWCVQSLWYLQISEISFKIGITYSS
jgi:pyruvate decarboxylase